MGWSDFLHAPIPWGKKIPPRTRRKLLALQLLFWFQNYNWGWQLNLPGEKKKKSTRGDVEMQIPHALNFWMEAEGRLWHEHTWSAAGHPNHTNGEHSQNPIQHFWTQPFAQWAGCVNDLNNRMPSSKDNGKLKTNPYFFFLQLAKAAQNS